MIMVMLREALLALKANRLRSFLTMLGMIIGVGSVIAMLAIGQGVQARIEQSIKSMGSNLFIILPGATSANGVRTGFGSAPNLTVDDAAALKNTRHVLAVAPVVQSNAQVVYGTQNWNTTIIGSNADYFGLRDWVVTAGYAFDEPELQSAAQVALIGQQVASNLFGDNDPIGETLRIRNVPFQVIGVLGSKGQSLDGRDQDDTIVIPISTAQRKLSGNRFRSSVRLIMVQAESEIVMPQVELDLRDQLRQRHRVDD